LREVSTVDVNEASLVLSSRSQISVEEWGAMAQIAAWAIENKQLL